MTKNDMRSRMRAIYEEVMIIGAQSKLVDHLDIPQSCKLARLQKSYEEVRRLQAEHQTLRNALQD